MFVFVSVLTAAGDVCTRLGELLGVLMVLMVLPPPLPTCVPNKRSRNDFLVWSASVGVSDGDSDVVVVVDDDVVLVVGWVEVLTFIDDVDVTAAVVVAVSHNDTPLLPTPVLLPFTPLAINPLAQFPLAPLPLLV